VNTTDQSGNINNNYFGMLAVDGFARYKAFYVGPGIAWGKMSNVNSGQSAFPLNSLQVGGPSSTVTSFTIGYDFSSIGFVEARLQSSKVDAYDGFSQSLGIRFHG